MWEFSDRSVIGSLLDDDQDRIIELYRQLLCMCIYLLLGGAMKKKSISKAKESSKKDKIVDHRRLSKEELQSVYISVHPSNIKK